MDLPELDSEQHHQALRGLDRIHWITGGARYFWKRIEALALENEKKPLRVLDLATGGGGVPIALWRRADRAGVSIELSGCDISARALTFARARAVEAGAPVHFFERDLLQDGIPDGYDVVLCSLFLHHLEDAQASALLAQFPQRVAREAMVHDLVRNASGYSFAHWGPQFVTPSKVVHIDAPLSVLSAFTLAEVEGLAKQAGLTDYRIEKQFPFRFLFTWRRP